MIRMAASNAVDVESPVGSECDSPLANIAMPLFGRLAPLHRLQERDGALLVLVANLHECRAHACDSADVDEVILWALIATLPEAEKHVVEATSELLRHMLTYDARVAWERVGDLDRRRILWLAGLLRLGSSIVSEYGDNVEDAYVTWTDTLLHVELDGPRVSEEGLRRVMGHAAALEVASERRVVLTSSCQRWLRRA
jgi:hypothetical protein